MTNLTGLELHNIKQEDQGIVRTIKQSWNNGAKHGLQIEREQGEQEAMKRSNQANTLTDRDRFAAASFLWAELSLVIAIFIYYDVQTGVSNDSKRGFQTSGAPLSISGYTFLYNVYTNSFRNL